MRFLFIVLIVAFSNLGFAQILPQLTKIQSNVSIPFELSISEIERLINQSVHGTLYEDNSFTDNNNDQLKVRVEKAGDIRLKALTNNRLMYSVPLKIWAEKGYGTMGIYLYKDTQFNVNMTFISSISSNPNWTLETSTQSAGFVWREKPVLDYGKVKIPISSFIESTLKEHQSKLTTTIDTQIKTAFKLQPYLVLAWNQFAQPILLSGEDNAWLKVTPYSTSMKPIQIFSDKIKSTIGIGLSSETFIGIKPEASQLVNSIPNYVLKDNIEDRFILQTTANISYEDLSAMAEKALLHKEIILDTSARKVKIEGIAVNHDKDQFVINIRTSGFVNGTSVIKGHLVYHEDTNQVRLINTDFSLKTKNVFQKTMAFVFEGKIRRLVEENYGFSLEDYLSSARKQLNQQFNQEVVPGLVLSGDVKSLKPSAFVLSPSHITAVIDAESELKLIISGLNF